MKPNKKKTKKTGKKKAARKAAVALGKLAGDKAKPDADYLELVKRALAVAKTVMNGGSMGESMMELTVFEKVFDAMLAAKWPTLTARTGSPSKVYSVGIAQ